MAINNGYALCYNQWALDNDIKSELGLLLIISSLSAENGYCFANNQYFAELFNIPEKTISRKIKKLEDKNYITITYQKRGCEITGREIRINQIEENTSDTINKNVNPRSPKMRTDDPQKCRSTILKNAEDKNIIIKNTSINNITPYIPLKSKNENLEEIIPEDDKAYLPAMNTWLEYKKELKKTYKSQSSVLMCLKRLKQLSKDNPDTAMKIVEQSIANNWVGLFGLKDGKVYNSKEEEKEPYVDHYVNFLIEKRKKQAEEKKRLELEKQKEEEKRAKVKEVNIDDIKVEDLPVF